LIAALGGGFLLGLWELYQLRFAAGDIYPPYSSLRTDPLGSKALYESLGRIPGISTDRNYIALPRIPKGNATVLFVGQNPFKFEAMTEDDIKEYESLAGSGARVVIAMLPVRRLTEDKNPAKVQPGTRPIEKRWGVHFGYITQAAKQLQEDGEAPKLTALYFLVAGKVLYRVERPFGAGVVVLIASSYPMSNEALAGERDTKSIAWALGGSRRVIFDEYHLGLEESSGVVALARKYHLELLAAMLLLLLALFIWKNTSSLLPPRPEPSDDESVAVQDVSSGLANLLRRNVPAKALMATCLEEWEGSRHGGKFYSREKIERIRTLARREDDVVATYRLISRILAERSDS
jgi:hypothetical protein